MRNTKNTRKTKNLKLYLGAGLALSLYSGAVLIFAMPLHYGSATVVNPNPEKSFIIREKPKPVEVAKPNLAVKKSALKVDSKEVAYYKQVATDEAENYNLDAKMFKEIINCESGFNPTADHDGGNGKGITGFWRETFQRWNNKFFNGELDYHKQEDQIKLMARAFAEGESYRDDWSSWNKYKVYGVCFNYQIRKLKTKNG